MQVDFNLVKTIITKRLPYICKNKFTGKNLAPLSKDTVTYSQDFSKDLM